MPNIPVWGDEVDLLDNANQGDKHQPVASPLGEFQGNMGNPTPVAQVLLSGVLSIAYSEAIGVAGGTSPYAFTTAGGLPGGLTMGTNGVISGTPDVSGAFAFTVTVTDSLGRTGSQEFQITVAAPPAIGGNYGVAR